MHPPFKTFPMPIFVLIIYYFNAAISAHGPQVINKTVYTSDFSHTFALKALQQKTFD